MDEINKKLEQQEKTLAAQAKTITALKKMVIELTRKAKDVEAKPKKEASLVTPKTTFDVDDKKYKFLVPAYISPGVGRVLAKDMLKNPAELERLVLINSGIIKAV